MGKGKNRPPKQNPVYNPNHVPKVVYEKYKIDHFGHHLLFIEFMGTNYNSYPFYFSFDNKINIFLNPAISSDIKDEYPNPFQIKKSIHNHDTICVLKLTDEIRKDIRIDMNGIYFWNIDINDDKYNKCKNSFVFENINTILSINNLDDICAYINEFRPFRKFIYNDKEFNFSNSKIAYTQDNDIIENLTFIDADNNSINIRFVIKYKISQSSKDFARYDKVENIIDDYSCEYIPANTQPLINSSLLVANNLPPAKSNKRWIAAILLFAFISVFIAIIAIVIKKVS